MLMRVEKCGRVGRRLTGTVRGAVGVGSTLTMVAVVFLLPNPAPFLASISRHPPKSVKPLKCPSSPSTIGTPLPEGDESVLSLLARSSIDLALEVDFGDEEGLDFGGVGGAARGDSKWR